MEVIEGEEGTYLGGVESPVELAELKTCRSRRVLFLTDEALEALDFHRGCQDEVRDGRDPGSITA